MRERAAEIVTFDLGPRTDIEIEHKLREEAEDKRFTSHDRRLLREADADGVVRSRWGVDRFRPTLSVARLQKLGPLVPAEWISPRRWRIGDVSEQVVRRLGEDGAHTNTFTPD